MILMDFLHSGLREMCCDDDDDDDDGEWGGSFQMGACLFGMSVFIFL